MSTDLSKAFELLGVKPGVSMRELKAAHRDLAKVWHPDRFQHDPRLQEKAQEKLKEINEAYDLLSSGKVPRPTVSSPPPPKAAYSQPTYYSEAAQTSSGHSAGSWKWVAVLLVFVAVFAYTTRSLLLRRQSVAQQEAEQPAQLDQEASSRSDSRQRPDATRRETHEGEAAAPEAESSTSPVETQPAAVATVAVTIDPASGLLAKPDCPVRSRMTYPRGSEPTAHCNINHTPPPKDSKIKSLAEKILK